MTQEQANHLADLYLENILKSGELAAQHTEDKLVIAAIRARSRIAAEFMANGLDYETELAALQQAGKGLQ